MAANERIAAEDPVGEHERQRHKADDDDSQPQDPPETPAPRHRRRSDGGAGLPAWAKVGLAAFLSAVGGTVTTLQFLGNEFLTRKEFTAHVEAQKKLEAIADLAVTRSELAAHINTGHPDTASQLSRINERLATIETNVQWMRDAWRKPPAKN